MDDKKMPLVSIVITSYNRANWIGKAIESTLAQDYPNLEIVISDNCSTDNTDEIIKGYSHDPRIRYIRNEKNIGMMPNFSKAFFELAKGKYVTHLSSDDYLANSTFISKSVDIFNKYESVSIVFGIHNRLNEKTGVIGPNLLAGKYDNEYTKGMEVFYDFADHPFYSMGGAVYNLSHLNRHNIRFTGRATGDIEINLELMLYGDAGFINESVYIVRVHDTNASSGMNGAAELEHMYLDVYDYIYKKATPVVADKRSLGKWYEKLITRNIMVCLYMIISKKDRKQTYSFHRLMLKKHRKKYLRFLATHPKFFVKLILNK